MTTIERSRITKDTLEVVTDEHKVTVFNHDGLIVGFVFPPIDEGDKWRAFVFIEDEVARLDPYDSSEQAIEGVTAHLCQNHTWEEWCRLRA